MKYQFWQLGFWHEKQQPTQRQSNCYQTPVWTGIQRRRGGKKGTFAVRTLRDLAGENWRWK